MPVQIRIVSDLHVGHKASTLQRLDALRSLAEGTQALVLNGDTLELKYGDLDPASYDAVAQQQAFADEIASWHIPVTVITGNHDPEISDIHSLTLRDSQIFVTHGDALFSEIAPWSSNVEKLKLCTAHIDPEQRGDGPEDLHRYLCEYKAAVVKAHKLDKKYNPTLWGKFRIFAHQAWPPSTPFRILRAWREVPDRALSLAHRFGLDPRFIVVGHTHNTGIWRRRGTTVINLGSYFPWPGARCIDITENALIVRRVRKSQNQIRLGRPVARFALDA